MTDERREKDQQPMDEATEDIFEELEDEDDFEEPAPKKKRGFLGSRDSGLTRKELKQLRKDLESGQEKVKDLEKELEAAKAKATEFEDRYLRVNAEFDNFRKRKEREVSGSIKYATEGLIIEMLPILNNFETALLAAEKSPATKNWAIGMEMIFKQLMDVLKSRGVEQIVPGNEPFDPNLHSAVAMVETDEYPDQHVMELVQKGYKLHDRVVQPASVRVAVSPRQSSGGGEAENERGEIKIPVEDKDAIHEDNK